MSAAAIGAAALLWAVVAIRVPTLTGSGAQRYLWIALVALATGFTIDIPQVAAGLQDLSGRWPNTPHLIKHSVVVVAAGAIREVFRGLVLAPHQAAQHRQRRILATAAAIAAMVVLFAAASVHAEPLPGLTAAAVDDAVLVAYWVVYLLALVTALAGIVRITGTCVRTFPAGPLRTGMGWMGLGGVLGLAYCTHKAIFLTMATTSSPRQDVGAMERIQSMLLAATVATTVIGLLWPTAARWPGIRHALAYRAYRRLQPLRHAYMTAEPAITLDQTRAGWRSLREIELQLYRRVIEIRDGMLAVRPHSDQRARDLAIREAPRTGHRDTVLIGEAAWLEVARRAKLRGDPPPHDPVTPGIIGGEDLPSEIRVLTRIAKNRRTIHTIADHVETATGAPASR